MEIFSEINWSYLILSYHAMIGPAGKKALPSCSVAANEVKCLQAVLYRRVVPGDRACDNR